MVQIAPTTLLIHECSMHREFELLRDSVTVSRRLNLQNRVKSKM